MRGQLTEFSNHGAERGYPAAPAVTAGIEPRVAADYLPSCGRLVRQACIEVAIWLSDFRDEICLVPSLIVDQLDLADDAEAHIGTIDMDLAFEDFENILL